MCIVPGDAAEAQNKYFAPGFTKKKEMEDCEISMESTNLQRQIEIEK